MFLGEVERQGIFTEACRLCSDCILGYTGGICPSRSAPSRLSTDPAAARWTGMCEVNHDNPCAWIEIYKNMKALNQLEKLEKIYEPKGIRQHRLPAND
jgi:hypothetical protein